MNTIISLRYQPNHQCIHRRSRHPSVRSCSLRSENRSLQTVNPTVFTQTRSSSTKPSSSPPSSGTGSSVRVDNLLLKLLLGVSVAAATLGGVLYQQFYLHAPWKQKLGVRATLLEPLPGIHTIQLERPHEQKILTLYFNSPPSGPSVVIGPHGAGKRNLLRKVLQGRPMTLWLDLKERPVTNGEEFLRAFIKRTGYILPSSGNNKWISNLLTPRRNQGKEKNQFAEEADEALNIIAQTLQRERDAGWPDGVPIICLNDIHRLGSCNDLELRNTKVSDDPNFLKFMDWTMHITDLKLAHVIFATSYSFSHLDLDTHAQFRHRRYLISIEFPDLTLVKNFFDDVMARPEFESVPLSPAVIDNIIKHVGGQEQDLDRLLTGLRRGDAYVPILREMITDSIAYIETFMDKVLKEKSDDKIKAFEKWLRMWDMMELLQKEKRVNKRKLIVNVFNEHADELEPMLAANLISMTNEIFPEGNSKKSDSISSLLHQSLDSVAITAGSPKLFTAMGLLIKDPTMLKQVEQMRESIAKKKEKEKEKELLEKKKIATEDLEKLRAHLEKMIDKKTDFIDLFGEEGYSLRKAEYIYREEVLRKDLLGMYVELEKIRNGASPPSEVPSEKK